MNEFFKRVTIQGFVAGFVVGALFVAIIGRL